MKLRLAQMAIVPGQPAQNAKTLLNVLSQSNHIDLVVAPELCVPGYLIGDLWELPAFGREVEHWNQVLIESTASGPSLLFGTLVVDRNDLGFDGRPRRYNAWILAKHGQAQMHPATGFGFGVKTLLPNYREFDEGRYFYDLRSMAVERRVELDVLLQPMKFVVGAEQTQLGIMICEDIWDHDYNCSPAKILVQNGADVLINLSQSPYTFGKQSARVKLFNEKIQTLKKPLIYVNGPSVQNNGKTVFAFDGQSTICLADGNSYVSQAFQDQNVDVQLINQKLLVGSELELLESPSESITNLAHAFIFGTQKFCQNLGISKVVIGVSGGIDSALSAALFTHVLGPQNVLCVNLPSRFNSNTTKSLAKTLVQNLGAWYGEIAIDQSVALTQNQIDGLAITRDQQTQNLKLNDLAMENIQARDRSSRVLAALSAAWGGPFPSNANKAETMVGYSTLYGDHAGFFAPMADLWKHQVYDLARYFNQNIFKKDVISEGIFTVVPSAELSLAQNVDQGLGDPLIYPYHDRLFSRWMQSWNRWSPEETVEAYLKGTLTKDIGCPELDLKKYFPTSQSFIHDLERWWTQFQGMGVSKRIQAPPVLALSQRAFGFDYREHQGQIFWSEKYLTLKQQVLNKLS